MCEGVARFAYKIGIPFTIIVDDEFIQACDSIERVGRMKSMVSGAVGE